MNVAVGWAVVVGVTLGAMLVLVGVASGRVTVSDGLAVGTAGVSRDGGSPGGSDGCAGGPGVSGGGGGGTIVRERVGTVCPRGALSELPDACP